MPDITDIMVEAMRRKASGGLDAFMDYMDGVQDALRLANDTLGGNPAAAINEASELFERPRNEMTAIAAGILPAGSLGKRAS